MSNQNQLNTNTKGQKGLWWYKYILMVSSFVIFIIGIVLPMLLSLDIFKTIIAAVATIFIIGLIVLSEYFISKTNLKNIEASLNRSAERIEILSKQNKIGTIDRRQISDFIKEADEIWVMNPLSNLSIIEDAIIKSTEKGCKRRYIISNIERRLYEEYLKKLKDKIKRDVNLDSLFVLTPISPKFVFPLSIVICDPLNAKKARVWVHLKDATEENMYGPYIEDEKIVSQFVGTFSSISSNKGGV